MDDDEITELSLDLEALTGYDSVLTVANMIEDTHQCYMPGCKFKRRNPVRMWQHIHFTPHTFHLRGEVVTEGMSFGKMWDQLDELRAETPTRP